jgi:toxin ParE1/3/4
MTVRLKLRRIAEAELDETVAYYEKAESGLGLRFAAAVAAVFETAVKDPHRYPVADGDVREAAVPDFPYCVYYRCRKPFLIVVAVYHQFRDPSGWQGRP